jgi:hypothetical protein
MTLVFVYLSVYSRDGEGTYGIESVGIFGLLEIYWIYLSYQLTPSFVHERYGVTEDGKGLTRYNILFLLSSSLSSLLSNTSRC